MSPPAVDYFFLHHPLRRIASRVSHHVRREIFARFLDIIQPDAETRILDVGVTPDQDLPESNFFEALYPYKHRIVATGIEDASFLEEQYPGLSFIQTDGKTLPFADEEFDCVFCSAVLEHVGSTRQQQEFVAELVRVARSFFVTTPNRQYPIEFHTFLPVIHWLPKPVHQAVLRKLGMQFWASTQNLNLLTPGSLLRLFPRQTPVNLIRVYLAGFPSNLIAFGTRK